jgi:hypothetical protein
MSHLHFTYDGAPLGYDVPPTKISIPQRAELGEISMGSISPEDPTSALTLVGHRPIIIEELDCAQPRLFTGWTVERNMGRSFEQTQFVGPDALIHDTTIVDLNAALNFRIITWTDGKRPEESVDARLAWLLASNYLAGPDGTLCEDTGFVQTGFSLLMDATDYRASYPADVLSDLSTRYATPINFFLFWDATVSKASLFFDYVSAATFDCTLSISNQLVDQSATCFAPITESRLERTPEGVYSDVIVNYANNRSIYRYLVATGVAFVKRGTSINRPYTGKSTTAIQQGDAWLAAHNKETDRITTTIHVPAAQVGLIQAGMRMNVTFSHLTDYTGVVSMRIVACNPRPTDDLARYYDVDLELVSPQPSTVGAFMVLDGCGSGFYGNPTRYFWLDGGERVTWATDGDDPPAGYPYEPSSGPFENYWAGFYDAGMHAPDGQGLLHGIRVTADGILSLSHEGGFGGVAGNWSGGVTQITAEIRQTSPTRGTRGVVIHTETQTEPMLGGAYSWMGSFTFALPGIVAYAGDEFEVSVKFISWVGFAYYSSIPAVFTNFSLTGVMDWGITDGGDVGPPIGSTVTDETPTPAPDGSNATFALVDGYIPGSLLVSVDGIPIPASEVTETNPPGVTPDWHGTFTLSWAPDADERVVVTYKVG